jgi:glycosyltransferase involved in cell wall biosynthesis
MGNSKTVSVVIPVYNRGGRLREAVMSVLLQSYNEIEIIIVDDGSTDTTNAVVRELSEKWQKTIIREWQPNSGPGKARELGTQTATGDFIQYLDSDDILMHEKISSQIDAFLKHGSADICYGLSYQEDHAFTPALLAGPLRDTGKELSQLFPRLLNERWWTTSTPLYKTTLIRSLGPWMRLINEEDWEFDARAARNKAVLTWSPHVVSVRRINLGTDHLSYGGHNNPLKLRDRVVAKQKLFEYAVIAGLSNTDQEMEVFSRECFLLARQCAEAGLENESEIIFKLSRQASGKFRRFGIDFVLYAIFAYLFGWCNVGKLTTRLRSVLK